MVFRFIVLGLLSMLVATSAYSKSHAFIGFHKFLKDTQNSKGKVEEKPFSPTLGFGYHFNIMDSRFGFSPQIGYIHTKQTADDKYGKQKIHTVFINWDFLWISPLSDQLAFRFGIGNFIKRTSGEGGTVEIPNGSGTDQARRPSGTVNSYSNTFNFGADYNFNVSQIGNWIEDIGVRFETYAFRPLSQEYRTWAFNFGAILYF